MKVICPTCSGEGEVYRRCYRAGIYQYDIGLCVDCNGSGNIEEEEY
jgi:DnaJ-class molecular chaperone